MSDTPEAQNNYPEEPGVPEVNPEVDEGIDAASLAAHYEQDDVNVVAIARFGAGIAVASIVAMVILWLVMRSWTSQALTPTPQVEPAAVEAPAAPGPGLDAAPELTLERVRARDAARLNSYGWVDRDNGIVHIPIEEAMRLLLERGVAAREGDAPDFSLDDAWQMDSSGGTLPLGAQEARDE